MLGDSILSTDENVFVTAWVLYIALNTMILKKKQACVKKPHLYSTAVTLHVTYAV